MIALASEMGKLSLSLRSLARENPDVQAASGSDAPDSGSDLPMPTYTIDSDVSPLLPKPLTGKETPDTTVVTILRGSGKGGDSSGAQAAPKGS